MEQNHNMLRGISENGGIVFNVAGTIGNGPQATCGAAALDLQSDRILGAFEHNAHHGGSRQQAAQRGRG